VKTPTFSAFSGVFGVFTAERVPTKTCQRQAGAAIF